MEGSRLVLVSDSPPLAARWQAALRARMRARKWWNVYPLTDVGVWPVGFYEPATERGGRPHVDRLQERDWLTRGSARIDIRWLGETTPEQVTLESLKELLDAWLDEWRTYLDRAESVAAFDPRGWGALFPRVLLVGDRYNGIHAHARPFSNVHGASETLSTLLNLDGLPEMELRFANAYDPRGNPELTVDAVRWLAPRVVVSLGLNARIRLTELGVAHRPFPHPQHLGRFERRQLGAWGAKLKELCRDD